MNVFNPQFKKIDDWAMFVGVLLGILDLHILAQCVALPRIGLLIGIVAGNGHSRVFGGYLLVNALFSGYLLSFLLGSIMFAQVIASHVYEVDLREVGSGNLGVSNFIRIPNVHWALVLLVAFLDIGKGTLALQYNDAHGVIWAVLGHILTPWTQTGGGKGVAVYFGCALAYMPVVGACIILGWTILCYFLEYDSYKVSALGVALIALFSLHWSFILAAFFIYCAHSTTSVIPNSES